MADTNPTSTSAPACTPLEQEVLDEYRLLLENLNKVYPPPQYFPPMIVSVI